MELSAVDSNISFAKFNPLSLWKFLFDYFQVILISEKIIFFMNTSTLQSNYFLWKHMTSRSSLSVTFALFNNLLLIYNSFSTNIFFLMEYFFTNLFLYKYPFDSKLCSAKWKMKNIKREHSNIFSLWKLNFLDCPIGLKSFFICFSRLLIIDHVMCSSFLYFSVISKSFFLKLKWILEFCVDHKSIFWWKLITF